MSAAGGASRHVAERKDRQRLLHADAVANGGDRPPLGGLRELVAGLPTINAVMVREVERSPEVIDELEGEVRLFLKELEAKVAELRKRYELQEAA